MNAATPPPSPVPNPPPGPGAEPPTGPDAGAGAAAADAPARPLEAQTLALGVLAALAVVAFLGWAAPVFVPVTLALLLAYALSPVVDALERLRLPRWLAAGALMALMFSAVATASWALGAQAEAFIDDLPAVVKKVSRVLRASAREPSRLDKVQAAAEQLQQAAQAAPAAPAPGRGAGAREAPPLRVVIDSEPLNLRSYLLPGTLSMATALGQAVVVFFLTLFILAMGRGFRLKLVRLAGPTLARKKITVEVLDEIGGQIQRYLLVQVLSSALVGVALGLALWALGMDYPAVWAAVATLLRLVPYVGAVLTTGLAAAVAFVQFGSLHMGLAVGGLSLAIHTLIGQLLVTWLTSRTSALNPVAVFVGVLFWGWLWGVWGLLLGIPVLMAIKSVCDRVEELRPIGELLGN